MVYTKDMKVYCCQYSMEWEDPARNWERVGRLVEAHAPEAGSLLVLPEMFDTGFSMRAARLAAEHSGMAEDFLRRIAGRWGVTVVAGLGVATTGARGLNQAVVFCPRGGVVARYTKAFPFRPGGEHEHFEAGAGPVLFEWAGCRVAPFVCYDLRFPELQRLAVVAGAEVLLFIASWPSARASHWRALLRARAIENQCFVIGVNRTGSDVSLSYSGDSLVVGPSGDFLADAGDGECFFWAELDLPGVREYRARLPFLDDVRTEFLGAVDAVFAPGVIGVRRGI